jgi:hypothetical protein
MPVRGGMIGDGGGLPYRTVLVRTSSRNVGGRGRNDDGEVPRASSSDGGGRWAGGGEDWTLGVRFALRRES